MDIMRITILKSNNNYVLVTDTVSLKLSRMHCRLSFDKIKNVVSSWLFKVLQFFPFLIQLEIIYKITAYINRLPQKLKYPHGINKINLFLRNQNL